MVRLNETGALGKYVDEDIEVEIARDSKTDIDAVCANAIGRGLVSKTPIRMSGGASTSRTVVKNDPTMGAE